MAPDLTPQPPLPRGEGEPEQAREPPFVTLFALAFPASGRVAERSKGQEGSVRQPRGP